MSQAEDEDQKELDEVMARSKTMTPDERQKRFSEFEDGDFSFSDPDEIVASFIKNFDKAQGKI